MNGSNDKQNPDNGTPPESQTAQAGDSIPASGAPTPLTKEQVVKQLAQVVCICKGINLGRVLKVLDGCDTVADVNRKAGTGSGGCKGERCSPRIKILLNKKREASERKKNPPKP